MRNRLVRRATVAPVVVLALAAGGGMVWAANGTAAPHYRTAAVSTGDVDQLLTQTGTVSVVSQAKSSFPVAGTVSSVAVHVGDVVRSGQVLAAIDKAPLTAAVTAAEATLATAKATLETDTAAAAAATTSTTATTATTASSVTSSTIATLISYLAAAPGATSPTRGGATSSPATGELAADLTRVQADSAAVTAAFAAADSACGTTTTPTPTDSPTAGSGGTGAPTTPTPSPSVRPTRPGPGPSPTSTPTTTPTGTPSAAAPSPASCLAALDAVRAAQAMLATDEATALRDLQAAAATGGGTGNGTGGTGTGGSGTGGTGGTGTGGTGTGGTGTGGTGTGGAGTGGTRGGTGSGGTGTGGTGTGTGTGGTGSGATGGSSSASGSTARGGTSNLSPAARVTLDNAAVAAATTGLATAKANLAGATLRSAMPGTVAAVTYLAGQPESTGDTVTVIGSGPVRVTIDIPYASLTTVKVGQTASVTADGSTTPVVGTVTSIGLLPATSTTQSSSTAYPVTVLVAHPGDGFVDGGAASVSVTVKSVKAAVVVPNSALANGAVLVLSNGKAVRTPVQTGVTGALTTEVTSGVTPGQLVVLADLSATLPANSTVTRGGFGGGGVVGTRQFGTPGGFTGGGFTGGGGGTGAVRGTG